MRPREDPRMVAITGLGVTLPGAQDTDTFWSALLDGRSSARTRPSEGASGTRYVTCEIHDFAPQEHLDRRVVRRADRVTQLGLVAARRAVEHAVGLEPDPQRAAVVTGTGIGGLLSLDEQSRLVDREGPGALSPFAIPMLMPNATAGELSMDLGWTGPSYTITTACASSAHAIGEAAALVRDGVVDVAVAGGTEAVVTDLALAGFARMGALTGRTDDPEHASRPFDRDRDGFVLGEGAAFVVLEADDHARSRGATVHGSVLGYGRTSDAHHIAAPQPEGRGAATCMTMALGDLDPASVGQVVAHGTSTPLNDLAEAHAIRACFGDDPPPVTSIKGHIGHLVGAAGAANVVAALLSLGHGTTVPVANLENVDPELGVPVVRTPDALRGPTVLVNAFGFGGHNASLVLGTAGVAS